MTDDEINAQLMMADDYGTGPDEVDGWTANQAAVGELPESERLSSHVILPESFKPFPVDLIPRPVGSYIHEAAQAIGCDTSMIALPMLSAVSSAIGNAVSIEVKSNSWYEPIVIWTGTVAESGSNKSSSLNAGTRFADEKHDASIKQQLDADLMYETELAEWEEGNGGKRSKSSKPTRPTVKRYQVGDVTTEALVDILSVNPRGVLAKYDELAGLFKSFNQYKSRGGSDVANWLGMFRAESLTVDRKVNHSVRYVPRAFVAITGSIQPAVLKTCIDGENTENGLASRFLFARPPETPKRWTDAELDPRIENDIRTMFSALYELPCGDRPSNLLFSPDAHALLREFINNHGQETLAADGAIKAAFSKLEAYAIRFAGLFALIEACSPYGHQSSEITLSNVRNAITLVEWFRDETARVYAGFSAEHTELSELVQLIQGEFGGQVSVRELARRKRRYRKPGEAEKALEFVRNAGHGEWTTIETSGRPSTVLKIGTRGDGRYLKRGF